MPEQNVTTKFKVDITDLKSGITEANKQIKLANAEFKNATAGLDDWSKSADGLTAKIKQQNTVVEAEKKKLELLKEQLDRLNKSQKDGESVVADLTAKYNDAVKTYGESSEQAKKYAKQLEQAEAAQERNAKAADDLRIKILNQDTAVKQAEKQSANYTKQLDEMQSGLTDDEKAAGKADAALEDMAKSTKDAGNAAKSASDGGFTVFKGVLANLTTEIIDGAVKALKNLGSEITNVVTDAATSGDEIDKMSQKLGLSREAYQEWDYVLGQSGVEINNLQTGLKTLTNKVDDAKNGSETAANMFDKLGLSVDDLNKMTREEIFERVIYGMQGMADSSERAALANDLFGKSGQELTPLFNESIASTQQLKNNAHELGMVMSDDAVTAAVEFTDSMDTLKRSAKGLTNNLAGEFLPGVTGIMDSLVNVITGKEGLDGLFDQVEKIVEKAIPKIIDILSKAGDALANIIKQSAPRIIKLINQNLPKIIRTLLNLVGEIARALLEAAPDLIKAAMEILTDVLTMLAEQLPDIVQMIVDVIPQLVEALTAPDMLQALFAAGVALLMAIVDALPVLLEALTKELPTIIDNITKFLLDPKTIALLAKAAFKLFLQLPLSMIKIIPDLILSLAEVVEVIIDNLSEPVKGIFSDIWENMSDTFSGVGEFFGNCFSDAWEAIKGAFVGVGEFFDEMWQTIKPKFETIGGKIGDAVGGAFKAVINGALEMVENTINTAIKLINSAIKIINKIPKVDIDTIDELSFGRLAKGGVVNEPTFAEIGEAGEEAVVPLENNTGGLRKIAGLLANEMRRSGDMIRGNDGQRTVNNYNFTQTNNSPKALSRWEIYRQTKNLINAAKGV